MAYSAEILDKRATIKCVSDAGESAYGKRSGQFIIKAKTWANVTFSRGVKAMRQGALDAYDTIMVRMRWNNIIDRNSHLLIDDTEYMIQSFHADKFRNEIQITAQECERTADIYDSVFDFTFDMTFGK